VTAPAAAPAAPRGLGARWRAASKLLRRPIVVVSEVAGLTSAVALAALLPQEPDAAAVTEFAARWPAVSPMSRTLGLHAILTSGWFLALLSLALLSLVAVQIEQWRRLRRVWGAPLEASWFARAPYRRELPLSHDGYPVAPRFRRSGRAGLLGSPIFHLGLLVVVVAGIGRLLLFRDGGVRMLEGETLPADASAWQMQRGGPLSQPFALPTPLRLEAILPTRYASGALLQVAAKVALVRAGAPDVRDIAINAPLDAGAGKSIYILQAHGPALVLAYRTAAGEEARYVYLEQREEDYRGRLLLEGGREVRFRTPIAAGRPEKVEARLLAGPALLVVGELAPGAELPLGNGEALRLVGLPWWAQFWGSHDPSRPFFFAGVAIAIAGIVLLFGFVPVDAGVFAERDHLVVALRPQRFAPLFAERFEALCKEARS
jgi:cytochrome c biogenesis protein